MAYNLTNFTNANNVFEFTTALNSATNYQFGIMFLFSIPVILFIVLRGYGTRQALLTASFVMAVFSILFRIAELVPDSIMWWSLLGVAVALVVAFNSE